MYKNLSDDDILKRINLPFALKVSNIYDFKDDDIIKVSGIATELEFANYDLNGILKLIVSSWDGDEYDRVFFKETKKENLTGRGHERDKLNHFCDLFSYSYDKEMVNRSSSEKYPLPNGVFRDTFEDLFVKLSKYYNRFRNE